MERIQFFLTPSAGKTLIAKALVSREDVKTALREHTLAIIRGTTNLYLVRELFRETGDTDFFDTHGFYRGITKPPARAASRPMMENDVILRRGVWEKDLDIYGIANELQRGDIIFKGANAVNLKRNEAGALIGHPAFGSLGEALRAVMGQRAKLIAPVGVEKRVDLPMAEIAALCNTASSGLRFCPIPGEVFTEIDALRLFGAVNPKLIAAGGVAGYEGGCYFCCEGDQKTLDALTALLDTVRDQPPFEV